MSRNKSLPALKFLLHLLDRHPRQGWTLGYQGLTQFPRPLGCRPHCVRGAVKSRRLPRYGRLGLVVEFARISVMMEKSLLITEPFNVTLFALRGLVWFYFLIFELR
jgi:hypothetical protein